MKTLLRITEDNYNDIANNYYTEDINYLVNELNIYCNIENNNYIDIVEQEKRYVSYKGDYSNKKTITAKGYCQGDWQEFTVHYNESDLDTSQKRVYFRSLVESLERYFTHKNQYFCDLYEYVESNGKKFISEEPFDSTTLVIDNIEFPNKDEIKQFYINTYGENFDEIEINI